MAVKDENSLVLQQLKHPQDVETSEEKKIRYRLEWAIKKFRGFIATFFVDREQIIVILLL